MLKHKTTMSTKSQFTWIVLLHILMQFNPLVSPLALKREKSLANRPTLQISKPNQFTSMQMMPNQSELTSLNPVSQTTAYQSFSRRIVSQVVMITLFLTINTMKELLLASGLQSVMMNLSLNQSRYEMSITFNMQVLASMDLLGLTMNFSTNIQFQN